MSTLPAYSSAGLSTDAAWKALHQAASAPYIRSGRFAWHWARGKLGRDPVFRGMLQRGELPAQARVVDIGCGQGLVASLLQACVDLQGSGRWPAGWPVAASARSYTGIELMAKDVKRAEHALVGINLAPRFICADMRQAVLPPCDVVVILDVLHYVDHAAQRALLQRVAQALQAAPQPAPAGAGAAAAGRLLLRVGDTDHARGFAISQWVDRVVTGVRGHRVPPTWGRSVAQWKALLLELGFADVQAIPQSQGTPFANVLLVAHVAHVGHVAPHGAAAARPPAA